VDVRLSDLDRARSIARGSAEDRSLASPGLTADLHVTPATELKCVGQIGNLQRQAQDYSCPTKRLG
jgi:hypothetical protein